MHPRSLALLFALALAAPAMAAPTLGFVETFAAPGVNGWMGAIETNPGTGGVDNDGYLRIARTSAAPLGAVSLGPDYAGDWTNANIDKINLWLNDVDANQNLEIHVCVGNSTNFWIYKTGFAPPEHSWSQFSVDLTDSTKFQHLIASDGKGFAAALHEADRLHVRHDTTPFLMSSDAVVGEFGVDDIELTNSTIGVAPLPPSAGRPIELAAPFPNPARGAVACAFDAFDTGAVRVQVIDAAGRIVHAETLPGQAPGRRTWVWNGLDAAGRVAPAGVYRVRVTGPNGGTARSFVRVD